MSTLSPLLVISMASLEDLGQEEDLMAVAQGLRAEKLRWGLHMEQRFNSNNSNASSYGGLAVEVQRIR